MALRRLKPTSAGVRGMTMPTFDEITTSEPHKPLTEKLVRGSGRNFQG
ncbi:MAG: ribosomal protein, partial [Actinomycetota bacterium]